MDIISIDKLKVYANHGVYDFEKDNGQNFFVSVKLYTDTQNAAITDDLAKTINYAQVISDITMYMKNNTVDLIETVAEQLSVLLLDKYKQVVELELTVFKPEAPVDEEFENVSVTINRKRHIAYIAFGSNMGDSLSLIANAKDRLNGRNYTKITRESTVIKSSAYGNENQNDFYNGVWEIETYLEPFNLLSFLHEIENEGGRVRTEHWGPRTIDLDIILYDKLVMDTENLTIPHSDMANRDFVLGPLAEIAGYLRHPVTNKRIDEMLMQVKERHVK